MPLRFLPRAARLALLLVVTVAALTGCYTPYSKQALPKRLFDEREARALGYRIAERVSLDAEGFRIFTWPVTEPSAIEVANRVIEQYQAVGIANMEVDYTEWAVFFFWSYPVVTVTADLVLEGDPPRLATGGPRREVDRSTPTPAPPGR